MRESIRGIRATLDAVKDVYRRARYRGIGCGIKSTGLGNGTVEGGYITIRVIPSSHPDAAHDDTRRGQAQTSRQDSSGKGASSRQARLEILIGYAHPEPARDVPDAVLMDRHCTKGTTSGPTSSTAIPRGAIGCPSGGPPPNVPTSSSRTDGAVASTVCPDAGALHVNTRPHANTTYNRLMNTSFGNGDRHAVARPMS